MKLSSQVRTVLLIALAGCAADLSGPTPSPPAGDALAGGDTLPGDVSSGDATAGDSMMLAGDSAGGGGDTPGGDAGPVDADLNPALIMARPFSVKIPTSYSGAPTPLIVTLHGLGSNGPQQASASGLFAAADTRGFILAYPSGTLSGGSRGWNASCCGAFGATVDDVTYLRAVIADVSNRYNVDQRRVFLQGYSNGAFMSHLLACVADDRIAAVATVSGTMWTGEDSSCNPAERVAVMHAHGTADGTVAYGGGSYFGTFYMGAQAVTDVWVNRNGCGTTANRSTVDVDSVLAGAETDVDRYPGCTSGQDVELWTVNGAGHLPNFRPEFLTATIDFLFAHPKP